MRLSVQMLAQALVEYGVLLGRLNLSRIVSARRIARGPSSPRGHSTEIFASSTGLRTSS